MALTGAQLTAAPPEVLDRFASKEGTRRLLAAQGLPTIPGSDGMLRDDDHALAEAEHELTEALTLLPQSADAHLALGQVYELEGRHQDAAAETAQESGDTSTGETPVFQETSSLIRAYTILM